MTADGLDIETVASTLLEAAVEATPSWVARSVAEVVRAQRLDVDDAHAERVSDAAERAQRYIETNLGELLRTDIDRQRTTPLSVLRDAARFPVEVLHAAGAREVHRIDVDRWAFPNDPFGVTPASLADMGPQVHEAGIAWGAAKAHVHLRRRRDEGQL
ncbi:MAG: hypothetical protein AAF480_04395 [Actinomycetota bacterium]